MELNDQIRKELERGFTKSELERIWDLPKNSLSAVLNPENKATLSKKGEIRVKAYFDADPLTRPDPSPRISRSKLPTTPSPIVIPVDTVDEIRVRDGEDAANKAQKLVDKYNEVFPKPPITKSDKIDFLTS